MQALAIDKTDTEDDTDPNTSTQQSLPEEDAAQSYKPVLDRLEGNDSPLAAGLKVLVLLLKRSASTEVVLSTLRDAEQHVKLAGFSCRQWMVKLDCLQKEWQAWLALCGLKPGQQAYMSQDRSGSPIISPCPAILSSQIGM